jgi:hypothetical protein
MENLSFKYCTYPFRTAKSHRTINCRPVVSFANSSMESLDVFLPRFIAWFEHAQYSFARCLSPTNLKLTKLNKITAMRSQKEASRIDPLHIYVQLLRFLPSSALPQVLLLSSSHFVHNAVGTDNHARVSFG